MMRSSSRSNGVCALPSPPMLLLVLVQSGIIFFMIMRSTKEAPSQIQPTFVPHCPTTPIDKVSEQQQALSTAVERVAEAQYNLSDAVVQLATSQHILAVAMDEVFNGTKQSD